MSGRENHCNGLRSVFLQVIQHFWLPWFQLTQTLLPLVTFSLSEASPRSPSSPHFPQFCYFTFLKSSLTVTLGNHEHILWRENMGKHQTPGGAPTPYPCLWPWARIGFSGYNGRQYWTEMNRSSSLSQGNPFPLPDCWVLLSGTWVNFCFAIVFISFLEAVECIEWFGVQNQRGVRIALYLWELAKRVILNL